MTRKREAREGVANELSLFLRKRMTALRKAKRAREDVTGVIMRAKMVQVTVLNQA